MVRASCHEHWINQKLQKGARNFFTTFENLPISRISYFLKFVLLNTSEMVFESINYTYALIQLLLVMYEIQLQNFQPWTLLPLLKICPFLEDVRSETSVCDWSALFPTQATLFMLKQFIPDHRRRNRDKKKNRKLSNAEKRLPFPRL